MDDARRQSKYPPMKRGDGSSTDSHINHLGQFVARVLGEPTITELPGVTDSLLAKSYERQIALAVKFDGIVSRTIPGGILRPVSPKIAIPLLTHASYEEDDDLHTMFARLLAAAADPGEPMFRSIFPELLSNMTPLDARILTACYERYRAELKAHANEETGDAAIRDTPASSSVPLLAEDVCRALRAASIEALRESFDNLRRLALLDGFRQPSDAFPYRNHSHVSVLGNHRHVFLTDLGIAFLRATQYGDDNVRARCSTTRESRHASRGEQYAALSRGEKTGATDGDSCTT
jgi:hypothetical protein